jgi:hypothetical protein
MRPVELDERPAAVPVLVKGGDAISAMHPSADGKRAARHGGSRKQAKRERKDKQDHRRWTVRLRSCCFKPNPRPLGVFKIKVATVSVGP